MGKKIIAFLQSNKCSISFLLTGIILFYCGKPSFAASGDILRTINVVPSPGCSTTVGIAFDGKELLVTCVGNAIVTRVDPANGANLGSYTVQGLSHGIGAISWDEKNKRLWIGSWGSSNVYSAILDKETSLAYPTLEFASDANAMDGLAYDGTDDSIWLSNDASSIIYHYTITGTFLNTLDVTGKLGGCGNSGLVVADAVSLYLANNGCSQIYEGKKDGSATTFFAGLSGKRVEDLECDNTTFPGKSVIWSKDAYDYELNAFEVAAGQCAQGGIVKTPIIIVPGIGGSRLTNAEGEQWPRLQNSYEDSSDTFLQNLRLSENGQDPFDANTLPVAPTDILRQDTITAFKFKDRTFDFYQGAITAFEKVGYKEGVNLFVFPYDWRKNTEVAAAELQQLIDKVILQTGVKQVDILAHSMGGLVTRAAIADPNSVGKIRKVLTLGSPILGATKSLGVLEFQAPCFADLPWYVGGGCLHNPEMIQQVLRNHPGAYQLLPSRAFDQVYGGPFILDRDTNGDHRPEGTQKFEQWSTFVKANRNSGLLEQADAFHTTYDDFSPADPALQMIRVIGAGLSTLTQIREYEKCLFSTHISCKTQHDLRVSSGDGTVPLHSADLYSPSLGFDLRGRYPNKYANNVEHGSLPTDSRVLTFAIAYFGATQPTPSLQARAQVPQLSQEDIPGLDDTPQALQGIEIVWIGVISGTITDNLGGILGKDADTPDDVILQTITNSYYSAIGDSQLFFLNQSGEYQGTFEISGTKAAELQVRIYADNLPVAQSLYTIEAPPGTLIGIALTSTANLQDLLLQLDTNRDGIWDQQLAPTSIVTGTVVDDHAPPTTFMTVTDTTPTYATVLLVAQDDLDGSGLQATYFELADPTQPSVSFQSRLYTEAFTVTYSSVITVSSVDKAGNTESPQILEVNGVTAQLQLTAIGPVEAAVGEDTRLLLHVENHGPATATGAHLNIQAPETIRLISVATSQGGCFETQCELGELKKSDTVTVSLVLNATISSTVTIQVGITTATTDLIPLDNHIEHNIIFREPMVATPTPPITTEVYLPVINR